MNERLGFAAIDNGIVLFDLQTATVVEQIAINKSATISALSVTQDGRYVIAASQNRTFAMLDLAKGQQRRVRLISGGEGDINAITVTSDPKLASNAVSVTKIG